MLTALALLTCVGAATVGGVFFAFFDFCDESARPSARKPGGRGHAANQCRRSESDVLWCVFWHSITGRWLRRRVVLPVGPAAFATTVCCGPAFHRGHALRYHRDQRTEERMVCALGQRNIGGFRLLADEVAEWSTWNHVRTAASVASAVCSAAALAYCPL